MCWVISTFEYFLLKNKWDPLFPQHPTFGGADQSLFFLVGYLIKRDPTQMRFQISTFGLDIRIMEDLYLLLGSAPANCAQALRVDGWQIPFLALLNFECET